MEKKTHIIVSPETDAKIEAIRADFARDGVSVSKTAVVAMAINEKAVRSEKQK